MFPFFELNSDRKYETSNFWINVPEEISVIGGASLPLRQVRTVRPHNPPGMGPDHLAGIAETPRVRLERSANTRLQHTGAILRRPRVQAGFMEAEQERLSQLVLAINSQAARKFLFYGLRKSRPPKPGNPPACKALRRAEV